jgi:hypothetical protein
LPARPPPARTISYTPKARLKETEIKETSISACVRNAVLIFWG